MAAATPGRIDPQGCPLTRIAVSPEGSSASKDFDALIDTGFTGFAQMGEKDAAAVGLVAIGVMPLTDGRGVTEPAPVAWASIRLDSETREGFVFLLPGVTDVLVGVHFLRLFRKTLTFSVGREQVMLTDD